ncbi:MAG: indolepyruvate ferredoxin oxidoreductase subunit alpha [Lachnospiraceae bacterium]|nr:indolepyruvate ferredoxin oxidoreductase subunit alpha [Lachnospiraceae bacterium]
MKTEYMMGNSAIALGAIAAGVNVACGYPGTPSSEIIDTIAKHNTNKAIHVEWSVNEKSAMEVVAGASYAGARCLVTMKMMGLNVASDALMSLAYVGVEGGVVIVSADDPGPISSQTEQDTRLFAKYCRIPVFDPSSVEEAYKMIQDAFDYSEKYKTPVLFRPTTRIDHAYAAVTYDETATPKEIPGFVKNSKRFVIFPRLSRMNHEMIEKRNPEIGEDFSSYKCNSFTGKEGNKKAVIAGGVSYAYAKEYLQDRDDVTLIHVATPHPLPETFLLNALKGIEEVLAVEELFPYLEEEVLLLSGKHKLNLSVYGKHTGHMPTAGENTAEGVAEAIGLFLGERKPEDPGKKAFEGVVDKIKDRLSGNEEVMMEEPKAPMRAPVLCAGCPHRASFYAVKSAMKGKKANFSGDIGCYTLGNAMPLDMVDTCLCMGAGITMAQGLHWTDEECVNFAFVGDSTFFASGMTGVANAVYNQADLIVCVLDNSTTAMTGHQPHPGTGITMMGDVANAISIEAVLKALGVKKVLTVNPLDLKAATEAIEECAAESGVKAIIFKSPCIAITKATEKCVISDRCISCKKCIREIGCPAISVVDEKVIIDPNLCTGCGLCTQICPVAAIEKEVR